MNKIMMKCSKNVAAIPECRYCKGLCKRNGKTQSGVQRYICKHCRKTSISIYKNKAYTLTADAITVLVKEGCGIRSMARILGISTTTVLKRILKTGKHISKPTISFYKTYEVDELRTYYRNKGRLLWVVYALQKDTGIVIDFAIGSRTKATLQKVTSTLLMSNAEKIYTDRLNLYKFIIPPALHSVKKYGTNSIERKNLSLRTHLKRLSRRTICYSKSIAMLNACLKIYFWNP